MMLCLNETGARRSCRLVQRECPTIPSTRMPQENSATFGAIQGRGRTGEGPIRLGPCPDGFYGTSPLSESQWRIISGALDCKRSTLKLYRRYARPYSRMLQKPLNESRLWRGKLTPGPKPVQKPPMVLPVINHIIGGTRAPDVPIWDEITGAYEVQSAIYWAGVKKRALEYCLPTPPCRRTCQAYTQRRCGGGASEAVEQ